MLGIARASERNLPGGTKTDTGTPSFWSPCRNCIACWYSNQYIDKTATIPIFTNRLIVIVATRPVATGGIRE